MKELSATLALLLPFALASCANPASEFLGPDRIHILSGPDSVESFRVEPRSDPAAQETLAGFPIIERGPALSETQVAAFRKLALDSGSYWFGVSKGCEFMPGVGLLFVRGDEELSVLLCFSCQEWEFVHAGERVHEDFDPVHNRLVDLAQDLFPEDTGIQALEPR